MFGYVRPLKGSLRVAEFERFRAVYCGLCRTLSRRYSPLASLLLNYDLAFFAAAAEGLASPEPGAAPTKYQNRRCLAHPLHRRCMACGECGEPTRALELAADLTVVLACFKLRDDAADGGFWKKLAAKAALLALSRIERKAKRLRPELYAEVGERLGELAALERDGCDSLDMCADCFASILRGAARPLGESGDTFGELLYHVGRWIYIIDACDDLERDLERGSFNAAARRYGISCGGLGDARAEVERTLSMSLDAAYSAYERLDFGTQSGFVSNVLISGLDMVERAVLDGSWNNKRRNTDERPV